eukprot:g691.t1
MQWIRPAFPFKVVRPGASLLDATNIAADQQEAHITHIFLVTSLLTAGLACLLSQRKALTPAFFSTSPGGTGVAGVDTLADLKWRYVIAFWLATAADWLQGPYVYALYNSYGLSHWENSILFIFGFGASMLFGAFLGSWADHYGRRRFALLYCLTYGIACGTKHVANFYVLAVGRVLAGVATSLLYSIFECWLVCEVNKKVGNKIGTAAPRLAKGQQENMDDLLGDIFSLAIFGNSVVAILMGLVAEAAASMMDLKEVGTIFGTKVYAGQYCLPFDLSAVVLVITSLFLVYAWGENYGEEGERKTPEVDEESVDAEVETAALIKKKFVSSDTAEPPNGLTTDAVDLAEPLPLATGNESGTSFGAESTTSGSTPGSTSDEDRERGHHPPERSSYGAALPEQDATTTSAFPAASSSSLRDAFNALLADRKIQCIILLCSFFESSMFVFVFLWTPAVIALNPDAKSHPFGLIFALLMTGCMIGACLFQILRNDLRFSVVKIAAVLFAISTATHLLSAGLASSFTTLAASFVVFEICVGAYWPMMSVLKSKIVPETHRATLYNFCRVPLNFIVCGILLMDVSVVFGFLFTSCLLATNLLLLGVLAADMEEEGLLEAAKA